MKIMLLVIWPLSSTSGVHRLITTLSSFLLFSLFWRGGDLDSVIEWIFELQLC